ncbi:MAG TPA: hypothetical protein ACFYD1_07110 [Candidatus Hypogeohydataceae bacterium YC38]|nr:hypothetical protein [Candidatus Brocadiales bacterium]
MKKKTEYRFAQCNLSRYVPIGDLSDGEKTEHPLVAQYDKHIQTVRQYINILCIFFEYQTCQYRGEYIPEEVYKTDPKTVKVLGGKINSNIPSLTYIKLPNKKIVGLPMFICEAFLQGRLLPPIETFRQVTILTNEVLKIYRSLQPALGLTLHELDFDPNTLDCADKSHIFSKLYALENKLMNLRDSTVGELEREALIAQGKKTPGAGGKDKTASKTRSGDKTSYHYVKQDTKEGSKRVSKGILQGERGKYTFTRLPALAMDKYIRASNKGVNNPKDIEKEVIDSVPQWKKLQVENKQPNLKYVKRQLKKGIKKATGRDVVPFNPIPFKIFFPN